jgi:hypothetical protein
MPRRSGGGGGRSMSPSRSVSHAPARPAVSNVPARTAPPPPAPAVAHPPAAAVAQPQQPGMFAQMATTAAGVAVGSAVGHTVGHALTGAFSGGNNRSEAAPAMQPEQPLAPQQPYATRSPTADEAGPCRLEMKQFIECSQTQYDISLCQGFNEALKDCRRANGLMQ